MHRKDPRAWVYELYNKEDCLIARTSFKEERWSLTYSCIVSSLVVNNSTIKLRLLRVLENEDSLRAILTNCELVLRYFGGSWNEV